MRLSSSLSGPDVDGRSREEKGEGQKGWCEEIALKAVQQPQRQKQTSDPDGGKKRSKTASV
jgi:hypothetical protein